MRRTPRVGFGPRGALFFGIIPHLKEDFPVKDMMYALTHQCSLLKFVFAADNLKDVKVVLSMANINESTISPDLEGIASWVQNGYSS